jgi:hypothetical protein
MPPTSSNSLRTSETNYLQESYVFYDAIRERRYFNEISDSKKYEGILIWATALLHQWARANKKCFRYGLAQH